MVNFLDDNVIGLHQVIVLQHVSHTVKTAILKQLIYAWEHKYELEVLLSPFGHKYIEGVIVREQSFAIVTEESMTTKRSCATPFTLRNYIDPHIDHKRMRCVQRNIDEWMAKAYDDFSVGLKIHDDLEAVYIKQMDFSKADALAEQLIQDLLTDVDKRKQTAKVFRRLFGTNTSDGVVNVVPQLLAERDKNYYLKGRAGTGKSTFMKRVVTACQDYGLDLELYHCSFDPNSIDMVIVPDLNVSIFDSTNPHEFFPKYAGDEIIDLYEKTVTPGTDEKYAEEIERITKHYKSYMKAGMGKLTKAGRLLDEFESAFTFRYEDIQVATVDLVEKHHLLPVTY